MSEIDVSKCIFFDKSIYAIEGKLNFCIVNHDNCYKFKDCYYKQLQQLKAALDNTYNDREELKGEYNKLKAENEELKEAYCNGLDEYKICRSLQNAEHRIYELETALDEIEKIIKNFAGKDIITLPDLSKEKNYKLIAEQYAEPIKQILQKIKEVKDDE